MTFIDISPPIDSSIHVWPGDTPFAHSINLDMNAGANFTLSEIRTTVHVGAHADAPAHYVRDGLDIASRRLEYYIGRCVVIRVTVHRGERGIREPLDGKGRPAPRPPLRPRTISQPPKGKND